MSQVNIRKSAVLAAVLTIHVLLASGCSSNEAEAAPTESMPVTVESVEMSGIDLAVRTKGTLYARREAAISAKVGGRIETMEADRGTPVQRGATVAVLDDTQYKLAWQQAQQSHAGAKASLASARAAVIQAEENYKRIETDFNRIKTLWEKKSVAKQQYDHAETGMRAAEAQLNQAREMRAAAEAQAEAAAFAVEMAKTNLDDCKVKSPITGMITSRVMNLGEMVGAGTPIFQVESTKSLELRADISSIYLARLKVGQPVTVSFESFGDSVELKIDEISPRLDNESRSVEIKCYLDNSALRYAPGLYAEVEVVLERNPDAVTVSRATVFEVDGISYVYRVESDTARKVQVETGISNRSRIEIISGLQAGDLVVTVGQNTISDGSKVNTETTED